MMTTRFVRSLALTLSLLSPAIAAAQGAHPPAAAAEEGKAHFQRGVALFQEGDFRSALVEFRRAHELSKNYKILYNVGQTEFEVQDYAGALRSFRRYLAEGGGEIDAARRASVEEDIKKLGARVARVEVKTSVDDAEILVDDVVVGRTPLREPILVSIGHRKLTLQKGGAVSPARFVDLAGGDLSTVTLDLGPAGAPAGPVTAPPPSQPPPVAPQPAAPAPSRTGMWVSLGITGALTAGAVVTGVLALGAHGDAETKLGMLGGVTAAEIQSAHSKTAALALATDILGGTAIAMGGVTLALALTSRAPPATVTVGPRGAVLSTTF